MYRFEVNHDFTESPMLVRNPQSSIFSRNSRHPIVQEDNVVTEMVKLEAKSKPNWTKIAEKIGFGRTGKQCRERWQNHLRPNIKKGRWTKAEEDMIKNMYQTFGPK